MPEVLPPHIPVPSRGCLDTSWITKYKGFSMYNFGKVSRNSRENPESEKGGGGDQDSYHFNQAIRNTRTRLSVVNVLLTPQSKTQQSYLKQRYRFMKNDLEIDKEQTDSTCKV